MKTSIATLALVAALANSASAGTITASGDLDPPKWNGEISTPALPDQCHFDWVNDGTMQYFPGEHNHARYYGSNSILKNGSMIGGRWITNAPAEFSVTHRGASELIVEATNKLVNSSTGRVYDVQVDYNIPSTSYQLQPSKHLADQGWGDLVFDHTPAIHGKAVQISQGKYQFGASGSMFDKHYTVLNANDPIVENQAGETWTPETTRTLSTSIGTPEAEDRVRFTLKKDVELELPGQVSKHVILIRGIAWMVDSMGVSKYDPDNHDLEDGDYYIEHKVTCVQ